MSPPTLQPKFFIDRSLGRVAVPNGLREDGWDVVTLAEHYGIPRDEEVADTEWIADAASQGWAILMVRRFTANKKAIFGATAIPGPYIYSVQQERLDLLYPKGSRRNVSDMPPAEV